MMCIIMKQNWADSIILYRWKGHACLLPTDKNCNKSVSCLTYKKEKIKSLIKLPAEFMLPHTKFLAYIPPYCT